jgi:hypothetical protein
MTPVLGFLTDAENALTEFVHNGLLVLGGFVVGYVLGGIVAWGIGRYAPKLKVNFDLQTPSRWTGGIIVGLIVALLVFTGKGKPHGEGGDGKGSPHNDGTGKTPAKSDVEPKIPNPDLKKPPEIKPADVTLRVTVYGGAAAAGDRFYQLDDDRTLLNLSDLKKAVLERKEAAKGKVTIAILYPADKNLAPGAPPGQLHPDVSKVVLWASTDAGLDVTFPASK